MHLYLAYQEVSPGPPLQCPLRQPVRMWAPRVSMVVSLFSQATLLAPIHQANYYITFCLILWAFLGLGIPKVGMLIASARSIRAPKNH